MKLLCHCFSLNQETSPATKVRKNQIIIELTPAPTPTYPCSSSWCLRPRTGRGPTAQCPGMPALLRPDQGPVSRLLLRLRFLPELSDADLAAIGKHRAGSRECRPLLL